MSTIKRDDFSRFGKDFQESLCHLVLKDRPFADQIFEVLDMNFFEQKYLQVFVSLVKEYREEFKTHPNDTVMKSLLRTKLGNQSDTVKRQLREFYARISRFEDEHAEYVKKTALDFCKKQKLKEAMLKSIPLLEESSFEEVVSVITDAAHLGLDSNYGHDFVLDFEKRFELQTRDPITTGWTEIDKITQGGMGSGELAVVIAATGGGKSQCLVHLGTQAIKEGRNVVYYTLELADTVVGSRFDSCLTGVPLRDRWTFKEQIYERVQEEELGKLIIKEYPTKSASVETIKAHLEKLKVKNFKPDMVLVDYADLLSQKSNFKERRHQLESTYEELRGLAQMYNCCVWTASQTNRSGINAEIITMEAISEAFNKCFVSDFIFTVSRTLEEKEVNAGKMYIAKNRNGPDGIIYPAIMDYSKVLIDVQPSTGESIGDVAESAKKRQEEKLSSAYKKFKTKKKKKKEEKNA